MVSIVSHVQLTQELMTTILDVPPIPARLTKFLILMEIVKIAHKDRLQISCKGTVFKSRNLANALNPKFILLNLKHVKPVLIIQDPRMEDGVFMTNV
jgi:hypothetical protein